MVISLKKDFDVMTHLEDEWSSQQSTQIFYFFLFLYFSSSTYK